MQVERLDSAADTASRRISSHASGQLMVYDLSPVGSDISEVSTTDVVPERPAWWSVNLLTRRQLPEY